MVFPARQRLGLTRRAPIAIFQAMNRIAAKEFSVATTKITNDRLLEAATESQAPAHAIDLLRYYDAMSVALGPMRWWPAKTKFEVIVGAILTQSTAWGNVELAIANLRAAKMLTPSAMLRVRTERLATLIRPSGYFRQKAKKLKAFLKFLQTGYQGSLARMFQTPTTELREKLLAVHGIGPETADSILLYGGNHPIFVVDAYTHRILGRHEITDGKADYEKVRALIENSLPRQAELFNEFHALIVNTGKNWCRKSAPRCEECPLRSLLPANSPFNFISGSATANATLTGSLM